MICQERFKALIEISDNSEKEKNVYLGVKKSVVQVSSCIILTLLLKVGQLASSNALLPITRSRPVFTNIQDTNIYK